MHSQTHESEATCYGGKQNIYKTKEYKRIQQL